MTQINPKVIVDKLKSTLENNSVDYEKIITDLGQVEAADKRASGYHYGFDDHIKAMILSMLSNQRPWGPIARNMGKLEKIFYNYDHKRLEYADPQELVDKVESIKCGNRAIKKQMASLKVNIGQFKNIQSKKGNIDSFITADEPEVVARKLSDSGSPYKLKQIGMPLAMEYLKNVGVNGMKPDVHILQICGPERLNIFNSKTDYNEITESFNRFSIGANLSTTYLDNLFWIFGAKDYGEICSATPKCTECNCQLKNYCKYPH